MWKTLQLAFFGGTRVILIKISLLLDYLLSVSHPPPSVDLSNKIKHFLLLLETKKSEITQKMDVTCPTLAEIPGN